MTRAVAISGSRRAEHRPADEFNSLFDTYLAPFVASGTLVFVGGAKGIDTQSLIWLTSHRMAARLCVVVPGTVEDQPTEAREAIAAAQVAVSVEVVQLRHPAFPSAAAYHYRNRWMVDRADLMVAFPRGDDPNSGTIYTIDYATGRGLPRIIVPI